MVLEASDLSLLLGAKSGVNVFIAYISCFHGGLEVCLLKAEQVIPYSVFPGRAKCGCMC